MQKLGCRFASMVRRFRCREDSVQIRKSRLDSGLGLSHFQARVFTLGLKHGQRSLVQIVRGPSYAVATGKNPSRPGAQPEYRSGVGTAAT